MPERCRHLWFTVTLFVFLHLQVGYGEAAGCMIFLTSFIGLIVFRRCMNEVLLIMLGMVSFASGIYFMSFVTATYMFYLGKSLCSKANIK